MPPKNNVRQKKSELVLFLRSFPYFILSIGIFAGYNFFKQHSLKGKELKV